MTSGLTREPPASPLPSQVAEDLLTLADDELVMGHRHSEWLGLSPFLEEDLTMASIAQDELGHARALYRVVWPDWADREADIVRREPSNWRSCRLVERASPTWEFALLRHLLYDLAEPLRWQQLLKDHGAVLPGFHALVANVLAEERFHLRHACDLVLRLGNATADARAKLQSVLVDLWPDAVAMTVVNDATGERAPWSESYFDAVRDLATRSGLLLPALHAGDALPRRETSGATLRRARTERHVDFAEITESLLAVVAFDPNASW